VLQPIMQVFESYLGAPQTPTVAGQHVLDADYFRRIDAMNFTMAHDDGRLPDNLSDADIVLLGISRTSKTPTSLYLAQRGYKTTNLPLVPQVPLPEQLFEPHTAFVVCLIANVDRIADVRRNRAALMADRDLETYVDRDLISAEIAYTRKIAAQFGWPIIDVTRRSIEESATMILKLLQDRKSGLKSESEPSRA
jgi:regulator of PEP synthase PpsR (kinase-PPPase family)